MEGKYWDSLTESLWSVESWFKVFFLLITAPVWFPIVKAMLLEIQEVLAPEGGLYANREPRPIAERSVGDDPFLNIPLASHRKRLREGAPTPPNSLPVHDVKPAPGRRGAHGSRRPAGRVGVRKTGF